MGNLEAADLEAAVDVLPELDPLQDVAAVLPEQPAHLEAAAEQPAAGYRVAQRQRASSGVREP
jgi:hypothetical protein